MTTVQETNRAIYQRLHDATNSHDIHLISKTIDEVFHPDAVFHVPAPAAATAAETVKGAWAILLRAFPDIHVTVEDTLTEGDKIAFRNTVTGNPSW